MILDNASGHNIDSIADQLTNVKVAFLAPNTTSHCQTMDAGIIKNFKLHCRVELVNHISKSIEVERKIILLNIKEAIYMAKKAWSLVNSETISNCFQHTKIIGQNTGTTNFF